MPRLRVAIAGFVHLEAAALFILAVDDFDRDLCLFSFCHFDEAKTA